MFNCPVCGFGGLTVPPYENWPPPENQKLEPPYVDALGRASYEVCPLCEFEFGNDDNPGTAAPDSFESYREEWQSSGRFLIIGSGIDSAIRFGPLQPRAADPSLGSGYDTLEADIFVSSNDQHWLLAGRNGIEPDGLSQLRTDLGTLTSKRDGVVFFGDHDYCQLVTFTWRDGLIELDAELPSMDEWEIDLGTIQPEQLRDITRQIDSIEQAYGPLIGFCGGCGPAISSWYSSERP